MTDAETQPTPTSPPSQSPAGRSAAAQSQAAQHPAALIVAATLAFVGAAATIGGLFPDFWDKGTFALVDQTGALAQQLVFAASLLAVGAALLSRRTSTGGAAALAVIVAVGMQPRVVDIATIADRNGPRGGTGFSLVIGGFVLALAAAVIAASIELRPRSWSVRGGARGWATLAAVFGFAAAVGYAMSPFSAPVGRASAFSFSFGSPFEGIGGPRSLWAAILVVVLLAVVPPSSVAVGRGIGIGLAFGLLGALGGIAAFRLGVAFGTSGTEFADVDGAEGTWTLLAAGGATLLMVFAGLFAGRTRAPVLVTDGARPAAESVTGIQESCDEPEQPAPDVSEELA
jgi:hypothetical protein